MYTALFIYIDRYYPNSLEQTDNGKEFSNISQNI